MSARRLETDLLAHGGRLLLEYNESSEAIHRALTATAAALTTEPCRVALSYGSIAVALGAESPALETVRELRYNTAVQARVHRTLEQVCRREVAPAAALAALKSVEADTPRPARWLTVPALGAAAACLAVVLGADAGAAAIAGVTTALGLVARQELGRRHASLLALPLAASFLGALLGGLAVRWNWTGTPELALVVPALMLVPGPHLINGLFDLVDNYLPMSLARFGLAVGILLASALGILLGVELTLGGTLPTGSAAGVDRLNLATDMALAGVVTCGFALFYNAAPRQVAMAAVGGMVGHGLRFLALQLGATLEAATFLGGVAVGLASAGMARTARTPVAVIAFAGAVTMMPGLHMYRALGAAVQLARQAAPPEMAAVALGNAAEACLVVAGLALGLVCGSKLVLVLAHGNPAVLAPEGRPWVARGVSPWSPEQTTEAPEGRQTAAPPGLRHRTDTAQ